MKMHPKSTWHVPNLLVGIAISTLSCTAVADVVQPSVVAVQGDVKINGAAPKLDYPVVNSPSNGPRVPQPIGVAAPGAVATGSNSAAMVAPVPGQWLYMGAETQVELQTSEIITDAGGVQGRRSAFKLVKGRLQSAIHHAGKGASTQSVAIPGGTLTAHGTNWTTWTEVGGSKVAVYAGTVTFSVSYLGNDVDIIPGQIAFLTGEGNAAVLDIADLRTGKLVHYEQSGTVTSELNSVALLLDSRNNYENGVAAFIGTASNDDKIALSLVLKEVNVYLETVNLPPITPPSEVQLFPNWTSEQRVQPSEVASDETSGE
jgi:hypothetical protein